MERAAAEHDDLGLVGKTVSHYRVEAKVGSGGMGAQAISKPSVRRS